MFVKKGDVTKRREGEYPQSCAKRMTQTVDKVVNGLFKWKKARKRQSNVE